VTPIPIASFLAGSLLSILLPLLVLIALAVWYWLFFRRAPDVEPGRSGAEAGKTEQPHAAPQVPRRSGDR
jgi:hypothetical protein